MSEPTFSISDLAAEFGITPRAIRHYEEHGLLSPRREGLQRIYSKRDRTRLKLTLRGKRIGLALSEIRDLIDMYDEQPDESSQLLRLLGVFAERRAVLEQQRRDLDEVLGEIGIYEQQCRDILNERQVTIPDFSALIAASLSQHKKNAGEQDN